MSLGRVLTVVALQFKVWFDNSSRPRPSVNVSLSRVINRQNSQPVITY